MLEQTCEVATRKLGALVRIEKRWPRPVAEGLQQGLNQTLTLTNTAASPLLDLVYAIGVILGDRNADMTLSMTRENASW